jgi:nucleolin
MPKRERDSEAAAAAAPYTHGVFCSGLPYDASDDEIRAFFSGCGEVVDVRAPRYHDSGRLRGYAHIDFATAAGVAAALKRDGQYLKDRFLTVEPAKAPGAGAAAAGGGAAAGAPRPPSCTTLFVKGVSYEADEAALKAGFARFGHVVSTRIVRWAHTHNSKGFGYVQFEHGFAAEGAVKAFRAGDAIEVGGRRVSGLDWDTGAPKASFRTADKQFYSKTDEGKAALVAAGAKPKPGAGGAAGGPRSHHHHGGAAGGAGPHHRGKDHKFRDAGVGAASAGVGPARNDGERDGAAAAAAGAGGKMKKPSWAGDGKKADVGGAGAGADDGAGRGGGFARKEGGGKRPKHTAAHSGSNADE